MTQIQHPQRAAEDVLVIGAGPAGIATAYALEQANISYKVVDRAQVIGSTWCSLYPSLTLNTSRYYSHMPEVPFPREYGIFPTGGQYYDYLDEYKPKPLYLKPVFLDEEAVDFKKQKMRFLSP